MSQRNGRTIFTLIAAVMTVFLMVAPALAGNHSSSAKKSGKAGKANSQGKSQSNNAGKSNGKAQSSSNGSNASSSSSNGKSNASDGKSNASHGKSNASHGKSNASHGKSNASHGKSNGKSSSKAKGNAKPEGKGKGKGASKDDEANDNGNNGSEKITICHATGSTINPFVTNTISVNGLNGHGHHEDDIIPAPEGGCPGVAGMGPGPSNDNDKITICHATSSETNPFVVITISVNGLNGHEGHEDDIIPAPEGGCDAVEAVEATSTDLTPSEPDLVASGSLGSDPVTPEVKTEEAQPADEVLSAGLVRENSAASADTEVAAAAARPARILGGVLPFTGASLLAFIGAALGLIGAGLVTLRARRS